MEGINIQGSSTTPSIKFDPKTGLMEIRGRSIEEGSIEFYAPIINFIAEYSKSPAPLTQLNIQLEYLNTSSSRGLIEVLKKLDELYHKGNKVAITWFYEEDDEEILEAGEDFVNFVDIPFTMQPIKAES